MTKGLRKTVINLRTDGDPAEIQTENLPNTSLEYYFSISLVGFLL
jgi:hypothetical protein